MTPQSDNKTELNAEEQNAARIAEDPLLSGNITRAILTLALPVVAATALHNLFHIADLFWVSKFLGKEPTAAVGSSGFILWGIFSLGNMAATGSSAMVSRFTGARNPRMTGEVVFQGLLLAFLLSFVVAAGGFLLRGPIFSFMRTDATVVGIARGYLTVLFLGVPSELLFIVVTAIFRAIGDTRTPLILLVLAGLFNFIFDPLLMLGIGPFPEMGVVGTSVATVISRSLGVTAGLYWLIKKRGGGRIDWHIPQWSPNISMFVRILKIGIPSGLAHVLFCVVYVALIRVINDVTGDHGTASVAALTLGFRVESLAFMWSMGFSTAASTLVGQNLGAGQPDRAAECTWRAATMLCTISGTIGIFLVLFPKQLVGILSDDPEVIIRAAAYVRIMGFIQVPQSLANVLRGAFSGSGNTLPTLLIDAPLNFARVPLGYFLAVPMGLGLSGIWWAIGISSLSKGLGTWAWFSRGRWKYHQV
jgi:putative MATE family efflux protein